MKGNNTITINQSSMIEAVQQWLDGQLLNAGEFGRVTKVEAESKNYGAQTFSVDLEKPDAQVESK